MPMTEIYLCKPGQALKEGQLAHGDIADKHEAQADAQSRLKFRPEIAKIAYYHLKDDGSFRLIHTEVNPNPRPATGGARKPVGGGGGGLGARPTTKAKPKPKGAWDKFKDWLNS